MPPSDDASSPTPPLSPRQWVGLLLLLLVVLDPAAVGRQQLVEVLASVL